MSQLYHSASKDRYVYEAYNSRRGISIACDFPVSDRNTSTTYLRKASSQRIKAGEYGNTYLRQSRPSDSEMSEVTAMPPAATHIVPHTTRLSSESYRSGGLRPVYSSMSSMSCIPSYTGTVLGMRQDANVRKTRMYGQEGWSGESSLEYAGTCTPRTIVLNPERNLSKESLPQTYIPLEVTHYRAIEQSYRPVTCPMDRHVSDYTTYRNTSSGTSRGYRLDGQSTRYLVGRGTDFDQTDSRRSAIVPKHVSNWSSNSKATSAQCEDIGHSAIMKGQSSPLTSNGDAPTMYSQASIDRGSPDVGDAKGDIKEHKLQRLGSKDSDGPAIGGIIIPSTCQGDHLESDLNVAEQEVVGDRPVSPSGPVSVGGDMDPFAASPLTYRIVGRGNSPDTCTINADGVADRLQSTYTCEGGGVRDTNTDYKDDQMSSSRNKGGGNGGSAVQPKTPPITNISQDSTLCTSRDLTSSARGAEARTPLGEVREAAQTARTTQSTYRANMPPLTSGELHSKSTKSQRNYPSHWQENASSSCGSRDRYRRRSKENGVKSSRAKLNRPNKKELFAAQASGIEPFLVGNLMVYRLISELRSCIYGTIWLTSGLKDKVLYAVKAIPTSSIEVGVATPELPLLEVCLAPYIRENIESPNVFNIREAFKKGPYHYVVSQFAMGEDLIELLRYHPNGIAEQYAGVLLYQAAKGIQAYHDRNITLQDFSLENCFLYVIPGNKEQDWTYQVRVADLGQTAILKKDQKTIKNRGLVGKRFRPPEIIYDSEYNPKLVDAWCLGWSACLLLTATELFPETYIPDSKAKESWQWNMIRSGKHYELMEKLGILGLLSREARSFIKQLLEPNPLRRLSIDKALNHSFLKQFEDGYVSLKDLPHPNTKQRLSSNPAIPKDLFSVPSTPYFDNKFLRSIGYDTHLVDFVMNQSKSHAKKG